jgi:hypothetical protein
MTLKSMSVAQLQDLRGKVEAAISEKVTERRQELQAELTKLGHIDGRSARKARRRPARTGRPAVPRSEGTLAHLGGPRPRAALAQRGAQIGEKDREFLDQIVGRMRMKRRCQTGLRVPRRDARGCTPDSVLN